MFNHPRKLLACALVSFSMLAASDSKAENVTIVSMILGEKLQEQDGSGLYGEMSAQVLNSLKSPIKPNIYPFKRALKTFFTGDANCIWALDTKFLKQVGFKGDNTIESELFFNSSQHIFQLSDEIQISSFGELKGRRIGILNGSNIEKKLRDVSGNVLPVPDQDTKLRMLFNERLDVVGGWIPDLYVTMLNLGYSADSIKPSLFIAKSGVKIVCHKSPETTKFIEEVNPIIRRFLKTTEFHTILKKFGVPYKLLK